MTRSPLSIRRIMVAGASAAAVTMLAVGATSASAAPAPLALHVSKWHFVTGGQVPAGYDPTPGAPVSRFVHSRVPMRLTWSASDATGAVSYDFSVYRPSDGALIPILSGTTRTSGDWTTADATLFGGGGGGDTVYFQVVARDASGATTTVDRIPLAAVSSEQENGVTSRSDGTGFWGAPSVTRAWRPITSSTLDGGSALGAGRSGARINIPFTSAGGDIAVEASTGPTFAAFDAYLDGVRVGSGTSHATEQVDRVLVYRHTLPPTGNGQRAAHTLSLVERDSRTPVGLEVDGIFVQ